MENVILIKSSIIENCLRRVKEEYEGFEDKLDTQYTKQDSIILNIQRAIQACMDMASYIIKEKKWGIPQNSREAFELLAMKEIITDDLAVKMKKMIGFRNIAVHEYKKLNIDIVKMIIEKHLSDLESFSSLCLQYINKN